ncbi:hypothetical protein [Sessilibacter corallicola]|uniref:hypothetical protein n=1 Tax=Sessilibacter corallicola TaxID=2904075 RepID=UPI001E587DD6|nr:hypothetical protein [Sessilibacter corallicola]MCE2029000.1 hypothetical protein [Sessilibacter corallicola]
MQLGSVKVTGYCYCYIDYEHMISISAPEGQRMVEPESLRPHLTEQEFEVYLAGYLQAFNDRNKERCVFPVQILDGSAAQLLKCNWNDVDNVVAIKR